MTHQDFRRAPTETSRGTPRSTSFKIRHRAAPVARARAAAVSPPVTATRNSFRAGSARRARDTSARSVAAGFPRRRGEETDTASPTKDSKPFDRRPAPRPRGRGLFPRHRDGPNRTPIGQATGGERASSGKPTAAFPLRESRRTGAIKGQARPRIRRSRPRPPGPASKSPARRGAKKRHRTRRGSKAPRLRGRRGPSRGYQPRGPWRAGGAGPFRKRSCAEACRPRDGAPGPSCGPKPGKRGRRPSRAAGAPRPPAVRPTPGRGARARSSLFS